MARKRNKKAAKLKKPLTDERIQKILVPKAFIDN